MKIWDDGTDFCQLEKCTEYEMILAPCLNRFTSPNRKVLPKMLTITQSKCFQLVLLL